jgi:hypothetical protein
MTADDLPTDVVVLHTIVIHQAIDPSGEVCDWCKAETPEGDPIPLATALGMLRLAEDTLIRTAMGE